MRFSFMETCQVIYLVAVDCLTCNRTWNLLELGGIEEGRTFQKAAERNRELRWVGSGEDEWSLATSSSMWKLIGDKKQGRKDREKL